jgi:hypothetical protein
MNENEKKPPLSTIEIYICAVLLPILLTYSFIFLQDRMLLLCRPIPRWFVSPIGVVMIILFNVGWTALLKLGPLRKVKLKIKIFLTLFVLTLSGSVLAYLFYVFYGMHMHEKLAK